MSFKESVNNAIEEDRMMVMGENNHPALSLEGLGDNLIGLFFGLVRDRKEKRLIDDVRDIIKKGNKNEIKNLFLIVFQTRWCRGGKGEKKLFYIMFTELIKEYFDVCCDLLELIPHYGCWKDFRSLYLYYIENNEINAVLFEKMNDILEKQLRIDMLELDKTEMPKISLLAKYYGPKYTVSFKNRRTLKSSVGNDFFKELSRRIFKQNDLYSKKSVNFSEMNMRKKFVELRKLLDIPEVKMCANKWDEINFSKVTSLCLSRNNLAFLDEDKEGNIKHPDDSGRKQCRENLLSSLSKGAKGGQLYPNELVEKIIGVKKISEGVKLTVNAQWDNLLKTTKDQIKNKVLDTGKNDIDLSRCVVMSDVSGSMSGTPMYVSIGLGIMVSQLAHESFKDLVMTFDDKPVFHNLSLENTFYKKVKKLISAPWGNSTNFEGAMQLIIDIIERDKLKEEEIPGSLLVISDMQFNHACSGGDYVVKKRGSGWGTAYDGIKNMFHKMGERLYGHVVEPPQIIFWNVRADTIGFPASANEEGVTLLSGYSPSLLKFIFSGELEEVVVEENGEKKRMRITPRETLMKVLSEKALDPVRNILDKHFR